MDRRRHRRRASKMAKLNRESDSDATATTSGYNPVFVDTNLDTHLVTIVSDADTVSDLKKKIMSEHPQCFPNFGEIKIHALKVKRKGYFYHLSDSMLVRSAFDGARKTWFVSVDASSLKQQGDNQFSSKLDAAPLCITKTPSGDRTNLLPDSRSKRLSLLDTSLLPQPDTSPLPQPGIIQHMNQKVPNIDQSGPGVSSKVVSKYLETEVKHVTDDFCEKLSSDSKRWSDFEVEKYNLLSDGNKILETNVEDKDDNCRVGVNDVQCNNSPEGSLKTGPASKKKRRSKKKSEDEVSNFTLKDNNASDLASDIYASHPGIIGPEFSSGNTGKEVLNEMQVANMDVGRVPCKILFSDTNMRSDSGEIPRKHVECRNMIDDVHCSDSLVEPSKSRPTANKKRKRENKGAGNPSEENKVLLSNFNKETFKPNAIIPEISTEVKQKTTTATSDCLFIEPLEDVHLVASASSGKKKRKGKKKLPSSHDQVVTPEPFSLHDVQEESLKETVDTVAKDSDRVSNAAIVSEHVQHATLSGLSRVSQTEKHPESVQEVVEGNKFPSSSIVIDVSGPDAENSKGRSDAPGISAGGEAKGTKNSKKHHPTNVKVFPLLAVNEFDNLKKDVTHSRHENIVPDEHKVETGHPDKIDKQRKSPQNCDPEAMLSEKCEPLCQGEADIPTKEAVALSNLSETNIVMESAKSAGSRKIKKKRVKKSVATKQVTSSMEHADNSASGISSTVPRSIFNDHSSVEAKKEKSIMSQTERPKISKPKIVDTSYIGANGEGDGMSGNEAESFPLTQVNRTQENEENMDGNLKKKSKKNRSSDAKNLTDFSVKEQPNEVGSLQLNQIHMTRRSEEKMDEKSGKKIKLNQNSAAKSLPNFPAKEREVGGEELTSSNDRQGEVDAQSRTKRKSKSVKTGSKNQLTGQKLELEKNSGTENGSFHPQQTLKTVDSTQVPSSDTLEGNSMGRPLQYDVDDNALKNGNMDSANDHIEVSKCDGDGIHFKDNFVSVEHKHEVMPVELVVDKVSEEKRSAREVKSKKNAKKLVVPSSATSPDLQNSLKLCVNEGSEKKSHGRNSSHIQHQESLSKDEHNDVEFHSKSSKVSENGVKAPDCHYVEQIKTICQEANDRVNHIEVSQCDGDRVNFKDYFVSVEQKHEVTPVELVVDKMSEEKRSAREVKAKKNAKKLLVPSSATSPDLQNSFKSFANQGSERKSHGRKSGHIQHQESLSKEHNEVRLHSKSSKVSDNGVKPPDSHNVKQIKSIPQEAKQFGAVNGSKTSSSVPAHPKEISESSAATSSSSSSESSEKNLQKKKETKHQLSLDRRHVTVSKASSKKMGKVVNRSRREKSLLATPGAIFRDGSSESSEDEHGAVNSDASTRTPSDNSSSSGYSEGESKSSLDSPRNGSYGTKGKDSGKSIIKSQILGPKNITMDMILRSSRRFKKAKLTAAQLQLEDTESQPVDIVPDSQANL